MVGIAVHRTRLVDRLRVAGGAVGSAMHGAVGRGRELQLPQPVGQPALHRRFALSLAVADKKGAGHRDLHRVELPALRLDLGFVDGDVVGDIGGRGVLPEQQIVALRGDPADRALAAGAHPDRRMRLLRGRRLDDDIVELPIFAAMRERLVGGPRLEDHVEALRHSAHRPLPSARKSRRTRCSDSLCRCRNRAGRRTADRGSPPARPAAPGCATATP